MKKKGFTFIETLIYVAVIGLIVTGFVMFGISISANRAKAHAIEEVESNARLAFDILTQKVRGARLITSPTKGNALDGVIFPLLLDMPGADPDITFSVAGGMFYMTQLAGSPVPILGKEVIVTALSYKNLAELGERDNLRVVATFEYKNPSANNIYQYSQTLETAVSLRQ